MKMDSLKINQRIGVLNNREEQQVKLLMGEACVIANENEKALSLLTFVIGTDI